MDSPTGYDKRPLWQWLVIYLIIGGLIYAAIYYFYFAKKGASPYGVAYNQPTSAVTQTVNQNSVTVTTNGFQPSSLTIKAGETIVWSNQTNATSNVSSAPHPAHTDYPPLNLGDIAPGAPVSLVFPTAGTYKYHNHLNASQFGSITVQ
ncbi:MAG: cupredoxin domain-containing protein [Patescibacteria group bacterium]